MSVQVEARSREMLAILPNTVTCSRSLQQMPAACTEKAVCMKTQDEVYQKVRLTPRVPRVVLKSNSHYGLQDPQNQDVDREVREPQKKRIIFQDLRQTEKINKFSKESQDLIADMNNTEIFELCENSSKQQRPDCNAYWEMGIIYCSCGRNMKSQKSPTEFDQNNRDVTSTPGYAIKKNSSRGDMHGPSERQKMYYQAKQMLEKARRGHPTILSRWHVRNIGFSQHMQKEDLNHQSINTTQSTTRLCSSEKRMQTIARRAPGKDPTRIQIHSSQQQIRQRKGQQLDGNEEYEYAVDPKTGWRFYKQSRGNLQTTSSGSPANLQTASSSSSSWDQTHWQTSILNSQHSSSPDDW